MGRNFTGYDDLMDHHEREVVSIVRKYLSNAHYQFNPNDVGWLLEEPRFNKQFGYAKRIYNRIAELEG